MTEQGNRPAWEQLCPELPPRCHIIPVEVDDAPGRLGVILFGSSLFVDTREEAASRAWALFTRYTGITKKQWAEFIAPRLVREAAAAKLGSRLRLVAHSFMPGGRAEFRVYDEDQFPFALVRDRDICTAALAVIRLLEGE